MVCSLIVKEAALAVSEIAIVSVHEEYIVVYTQSGSRQLGIHSVYSLELTFAFALLVRALMAIPGFATLPLQIA